MHEGGHSNSSASKQNHNVEIPEQGGDAVTMTVLTMTVGNMENTRCRND
jgi:general stress protein YciG